MLGGCISLNLPTKIFSPKILVSRGRVDRFEEPCSDNNFANLCEQGIHLVSIINLPTNQFTDDY